MKKCNCLNTFHILKHNTYETAYKTFKWEDCVLRKLKDNICRWMWISPTGQASNILKCTCSQKLKKVQVNTAKGFTFFYYGQFRFYYG